MSNPTRFQESELPSKDICESFSTMNVERERLCQGAIFHSSHEGSATTAQSIIIVRGLGGSTGNECHFFHRDTRKYAGVLAEKGGGKGEGWEELSDGFGIEHKCLLFGVVKEVPVGGDGTKPVEYGAVSTMNDLKGVKKGRFHPYKE